MPRIKALNSDGEPVERYSWPAEYVTPGEHISEALRQWRRQAISQRDEFCAFQKSCGRDDACYARFFKENANRLLRQQRAITLMIPWFGEPDKGQSVQPPSLWPIDLEMEMDEIARRIRYYFG